MQRLQIRSIFFIFSLLLWLAPWNCHAQENDSALDTQLPENYVNVLVNQAQLQYLADHYAVDVATPTSLSADVFSVTLCINRKEYEDFLQLNIPYKRVNLPQSTVTMASTYKEMLSWDRYPTYGAYMAMMDTFRTQFPALCSIDTILAKTPGNHALLCAHISSDLGNTKGKPAFFYSSTIHGNEPVGYCMMLRLIHYLLHHYNTDEQVRTLLDSVDIWICPLENPDGTYHKSNDKINQSPVSTRGNFDGTDLNRSYPEVENNTKSSNPEIQAMIDFVNSRHITMSANIHDGSELFNYPWDSWKSKVRTHADDAWWRLIGRKFADTCHAVDPKYFKEQDNGVTEGGDWYTISGSRQDYFTYYTQGREVTLEISSIKVPNSDKLPEYWNKLYRSLLNLMGEVTKGISGTITDSLTGKPVKAMVYVAEHDKDNSYVFSNPEHGTYYRPIKGGEYSVLYIADGYIPKGFVIKVQDGEKVVRNVELLPRAYALQDYTSDVNVYPNPTTGKIWVAAEGNDISSVNVYDLSGRLRWKQDIQMMPALLDLSGLESGFYMLQILQNDQNAVYKKIFLCNKTGE